MNATALSKHPFFDPASLYSQMRAGARVEDKMRGYFCWLWARADQARESLPPADQSSEAELRALGRRLAGGGPFLFARAGLPASEHGSEPPIRVLAALASPAWAVPVGAPRSGQALGHPLPSQVELLLVREEDGTRALTLLWHLPAEKDSDGWWLEPRCGLSSVRCRAFLLEPEVVKRLALARGGNAEGSPTHALERAFTTDIVADNFEVARLLAAVPELEGEIQAGQRRADFHRLPLPARFDRFPPRAEPLQVVIVVDLPQEGPPANEPQVDRSARLSGIPSPPSARTPALPAPPCAPAPA